MKRFIVSAIIAFGLMTSAHASPSTTDKATTDYSQTDCVVVAKKFNINPFKLVDEELAIYQQCVNRSMTTSMARQYRNPLIGQKKAVLQDAE